MSPGASKFEVTYISGKFVHPWPSHYTIYAVSDPPQSQQPIIFRVVILLLTLYKQFQ